MDGYAFPIDDDLKYELLVDIDSLLFELNSCCELMTKLFEGLYQHVGKNLKGDNAGLTIREALIKEGQNASWFVKLDEHRNFFIHEGAPYIAADLTNAPDYDLLIMKKNLFEFNDPSEFLRLSEASDIVQGFDAAKPIIQQHLIELYESQT